MQCSAVWGMSSCSKPWGRMEASPVKSTMALAAVAGGSGQSSCPASALVGLPLSPRSKQNRQAGQLTRTPQQHSSNQEKQQQAAVRTPLLWVRSLGLLVYPADQQLVLQDLKTHQQQWLSHHTQPIGATALSQDEQLLATAAGAPEPGPGAQCLVV
jgi:hypothetical protein